jgi:hypothetical protein
MTDEAHRLRVLIESTTNALEELRNLNDPKVTGLVQDLERVRAESVAQLADYARHSRAPHSDRDAYDWNVALAPAPAL